jgi:hypothetical protein
VPSRLSTDELSALGTLPALIDCTRVRLFGRGERGAAALLRRAVLALSGGRAVALGHGVFLPDRACGDVAVLAHELTHCGQYQRWGPLGYFGRGLVEQTWDLLARTTGLAPRPYSYELVPGKPFDAYGMEQQGQIVEDCFRGDSGAGRVSPYRPVSPAPAR